MPMQKLDKETKKAIADARTMMEDVIKSDGNEAETRRRIERMFHSLMGYDVFKNITRERAIKSVGDAEHCDFAIIIDQKPIIIVEIKRANIDLAPKHLKQASTYAINEGCEWVILTNGREWQLHHVIFSQPPETKLITSWNLMNDPHSFLAKCFDLVGLKSVKKGGLDLIWKKCNILSTRNLLEILLDEDTIRLVLRRLKQNIDVSLSPEEVVGAFRKLLNEAANTEMDSIKISLPERKKRAPKKTGSNAMAENDAIANDEITPETTN